MAVALAFGDRGGGCDVVGRADAPVAHVEGDGF